MSKATSSNLSTLYSELKRACSTQIYDKVVNVSTKILSKSPTELKALQCKIVALIRLEKYEECLNVLRKFPDLRKHMLFEKAYAEYRLNHIDDAIKTLRDADANDLRVLELRAQIHYRKEEFSEAYTCLRHLIRNTQDDFGEERLTNLAAVAAASAYANQQFIDIDMKPEMFEAKFNMACQYLGQGKKHLAETALTEAEDMCRKVLAEDPEITEEEIDEELIPIRTQQAYLLQISDKPEAANQIYQSIMRKRLPDPALLAVIANNIVCINREQNVFDSRKRIKMASVDGLQYKLFNRQRETMLTNQGLFYWYTNQADACHVKCKTILQANPRASRALLLSVTQLIKEKQYDRARTALENYCSISTNEDATDLNVILTLAQLHLRLISNGTTRFTTDSPTPANACKVARMLADMLPEDQVHSPGVVSTRIALYLLSCVGQEAALDRVAAVQEIVQVIKRSLLWYEESENTEHSGYVQLLDQCATFLLKNGQAELSAQLTEKQLARFDSSGGTADDQLARNHTRQALVARLVRAYAQFDKPRAESACKTLKFKEVLSEMDVDGLETSFLYGAKAVRRQARSAEQSAVVTTKVGGKSKRNLDTPKPLLSTVNEPPVELKKPKKKKKRPVRLPKNYQPGILPDPDRWLPRRERATYRGKRRDKRYQTVRGPQGQVTGSSELDASVRSPKAKPTSSPSEIPVSTPKSGGAAKQQQHRKGRKKGR